MPPPASEEDQLADRVNQLEGAIGSIKEQLSDNSKIEELGKRIALCEQLAGIAEDKNEDVKFE